MLTGTLRRTVEQLEHAEVLPKLCNVLARVASVPSRESNARWAFAVEGLSGTVRATVAVHDTPPPFVGYERTAPELLSLFADERLRSLVVPGELVLVQAVPLRSPGRGLFLNVEAIIIVRPHRLFGRAQVDIRAQCARRAYLAVSKAARHRRAAPMHYHSVVGRLAHALFSAWACHGFDPTLRDELVVDATTLLDLVYLGLKSVDEFRSAVVQGERLRSRVTSSPVLANVLAQGPWEPESSALNNGVASAPDLLRNGAVVELKHVSRASAEANGTAHRLQVESYLAWAMVEFGIPVVLQTWRGSVVYLQSGFPEDATVVNVAPDRSLAARRILDRHGLLAVHGARWLPRPTRDCSHCDYADRVERDDNAPPPCTFYCQAERSWECDAPDAPCPLLSTCDQRRRWLDFEELDRFNTLRQVLSQEEEEREVIAAVVDSLVAGSAGPPPGLLVGPLRVEEHSRGSLRLVPEFPCALEFASVGESFDALGADHAPIATVEFEKRRGAAVVFGESEPTNPLQPGTTLWLRAIPGWDVSPRDLLGFLDRMQRSGRTPWIADSSSPPRVVRQLESLPPAGDAAELLVVDCVGLSSVRRAVRDVGAWAAREGVGRILVAGAARLGLTPPSDGVWLDASGVMELVHGDAGGHSGLAQAVERARAAGSWWVSTGELAGTRLDAVTSATGRLPLLVVAEAERLPLMMLARCFDVAHRVVLVGQAAATGPWAETAEARASEAFQNTMAYLLAGAHDAVPRAASRIDVLRHPAPRSVVGAEAIGFPRGREQTPLHWVSVDGDAPRFGSDTALALEVVLAASGTTAQTKEVHVELDPRYRSATSSLRNLLRGISPSAVEAMRSDAQEKVDSTLVGVPVRVRKVVSRVQTGGQPHRVRLHVPASSFRFVQERCFTRESEVDSILDYVALRPGGTFIVTSPFFGQCVELARRLDAAKAANARVVPFDNLGRKVVGNALPELLVSWVAGPATPVYPSPLDDVTRFLETFCGEWSAITLFASTAALKHHPVLQRLVAAAGDAP
jgi:hypothetical protein